MNILLWIIIAFLLIVFFRIVIMGPSRWDRLLGMSVTSVKIIVLIIFFASANDRAYLLDFAIIYAMFGFISIIFIALFLSKRSRRGKE
ncbi:MAG: monovalent cation/H+ antiporter complex subunit F [Firmicutes bacterium]|nr:monovalent cation/H+ antiporter complex subunit F [Bacillota bacterium]